MVTTLRAGRRRRRRRSSRRGSATLARDLERTPPTERLGAAAQALGSVKAAGRPGGFSGIVAGSQSERGERATLDESARVTSRRRQAGPVTRAAVGVGRGEAQRVQDRGAALARKSRRAAAARRVGSAAAAVGGTRDIHVKAEQRAHTPPSAARDGLAHSLPEPAPSRSGCRSIEAADRVEGGDVRPQLAPPKDPPRVGHNSSARPHTPASTSTRRPPAIRHVAARVDLPSAYDMLAVASRRTRSAPAKRRGRSGSGAR